MKINDKTTQNLFITKNTQKEERDHYTSSRKQLFKNNQASYKTINAVITMFGGEIVNKKSEQFIHI